MNSWNASVNGVVRCRRPVHVCRLRGPRGARACLRRNGRRSSSPPHVGGSSGAPGTARSHGRPVPRSTRCAAGSSDLEARTGDAVRQLVDPVTRRRQGPARRRSRASERGPPRGRAGGGTCRPPRSTPAYPSDGVDAIIDRIRSTTAGCAAANPGVNQRPTTASATEPVPCARTMAGALGPRVRWSEPRRRAAEHDTIDAVGPRAAPSHIATRPPMEGAAHVRAPTFIRSRSASEVARQVLDAVGPGRGPASAPWPTVVVPDHAERAPSGRPSAGPTCRPWSRASPDRTTTGASARPLVHRMHRAQAVITPPRSARRAACSASARSTKHLGAAEVAGRIEQLGDLLGREMLLDLRPIGERLGERLARRRLRRGSSDDLVRGQPPDLGRKGHRDTLRKQRATRRVEVNAHPRDVHLQVLEAVAEPGSRRARGPQELRQRPPLRVPARRPRARAPAPSPRAGSRPGRAPGRRAASARRRATGIALVRHASRSRRAPRAAARAPRRPRSARAATTSRGRLARCAPAAAPSAPASSATRVRTVCHGNDGGAARPSSSAR